MSNTLEMVHESDPLLRRWIIIGIGLAWHNDVAARWCAIRDSAHEKLLPLLEDLVPEVRAATAFALGTFVRSGGKSERNEHANSIDHAVALRLVNALHNEASPLVRKEVFRQYFLSVVKRFSNGPNDARVGQENETFTGLFYFCIFKREFQIH